MACCTTGGCACILTAGQGIEIDGSGTTSDPYIITNTITDLTGFLQVQDTASINMILTGAGVDGDPLVLRAASTLKLTDLVDVADPSGGPAVGESPVWVAAGHWEFQIPPPAPAGAVNAGNGISGIGSAPDPLKVEFSGIWGSGSLSGLGGDSTIGLPIYLDSAGDIRTSPITSFLTWTNISGKPSTFTPSAHTHVAANITDQSNINAGKVNGVKITSSSNFTTPPSSPTTGDLWFAPA
jgi:hypothetical protein